MVPPGGVPYVISDSYGTSTATLDGTPFSQFARMLAPLLRGASSCEASVSITGDYESFLGIFRTARLTRQRHQFGWTSSKRRQQCGTGSGCSSRTREGSEKQRAAAHARACSIRRNPNRPQRPAQSSVNGVGTPLSAPGTRSLALP